MEKPVVSAFSGFWDLKLPFASASSTEKNKPTKNKGPLSRSFNYVVVKKLDLQNALRKWAVIWVIRFGIGKHTLVGTLASGKKRRLNILDVSINPYISVDALLGGCTRAKI